MGNLFNFGDAMNQESRNGNNAKKLREEAGKFDLAGTGGFLAVVKYAVFAILASLNFHLFYTHIPGVWGVALGCVALLFEACAIYFWNMQNKSAGNHQRWLRIFAISFTVLSFTHGCAALYQLSEVGPSIAEPIYNYSKYVAFPLLFGAMVFAVCVLHYAHWSTAINEARANAVMAIEQDRAHLMTESLALESQALVENEKLEHFKRKVILEEKYVQAVEEFARVKQRGLTAINNITDPEVRQELFQSIGRTATLAPVAKRIGMSPIATDPKDPAPTE
jgi:hypothetical protein